MSTLSSLPRGEGIPALIQMVVRGRLLARRQGDEHHRSSGDPRAREFLRTIADRANINEDVRLTAIRGIGPQLCNGPDAAFLRPALLEVSEPAIKESVISSVASAGGSREHCSSLEHRGLIPPSRSSLAEGALRSEQCRGADRRLRHALRARRPADEGSAISIYGSRTESAATDKLLSIAKTDEDLRFAGERSHAAVAVE